MVQSKVVIKPPLGLQHLGKLTCHAAVWDSGLILNSLCKIIFAHVWNGVGGGEYVVNLWLTWQLPSQLWQAATGPVIATGNDNIHFGKTVEKENPKR